MLSPRHDWPGRVKSRDPDPQRLWPLQPAVSKLDAPKSHSWWREVGWAGVERQSSKLPPLHVIGAPLFSFTVASLTLI